MNTDSSQKSILFLAANPRSTTSLRLQEEEREIKERLRLSGYGKVPIYSSGATRIIDIQQAMIDAKPQIVHFSGHGLGVEGLVFEDTDGGETLISSEALANLAKIFSKRGLECILLNACYSEAQAEAIVKYIPYVIGMNRDIGDAAAIKFSTGFYTALGAGETIRFAYDLGCNAMQLAGISEDLTPVLLSQEKDDLDSSPNVKKEISSRIYPAIPIEVPDPVSEEKIQIALQNSLSKWKKVISQLPEDPGKVRVELFRQYKFKTFMDAISFMHHVAPACDVALHHPRWENVWKTLRIYLTTWDIDHQISDRDIQLAKYFDYAFSLFPGAVPDRES
jgi:pterin-4a-carbinolamine dehydratase